MPRRTLRLLITATAIAAMALARAAEADTAAELPLMPYPQKLRAGSGHFTLDGTLSIETRGPVSGRLEAALEGFRLRLQRQTGIGQRKAAGTAADFTVTVATESGPVTRLDQLTTGHEAYRLRIDSDGMALEADTDLGALRGLETLLQLAGSSDREIVRLPAVEIVDQPRFRWRGLLLDSVRHFFSVDTIKRQLDGMAAARLNVFHWHLTDDQGWRLESRQYPKLQRLASGGRYYTRADVREVVDYARARGIVVVPEIGMPGHSSAIAVAYPELMSAPGPYRPEDRWGVHTPLLDPSNPRVYEFADKVLGEVAELFPFEYVHIGGDEVNPRDWQNSVSIQRLMRERKLDTAADLHNYFNGRLAEILAKYGRRSIGWDEVLHDRLAPGTAVQSWRGADALGKIASAGHPAILSTGFYLDQPQTAAYHYRNRLLPQPLQVDQRAGDGEHWQTWRFRLPRKRGSAISGEFTLIEDRAGNHRGFIDFSDRSRQALNGIDTRHGTTYFSVDTWMGPLRARLELGGRELRGDMVVGNAAYVASGRLEGSDRLEGTRIPGAVAAPQLAAGAGKNILGGEAALWSELIDENSIDLRLWPRAFAVAERLWSPQSLRDEASLYRRLRHVSHWAARSAGLLHAQQQREALRKLLPASLVAPALVVSEALEPAHYYHRHHEKSAHESYSRRDPLDRFVDSLPAESFAVRDLERALAEWLGETGNTRRLQPLRRQLLQWRQSAAQLLEKGAGDREIIHTLAHRVHTVSGDGLQLIELLAQGEQPSAETAGAIRKRLREAQQMHGETVVAAAYPLERLLDAAY